MASSSGMCYLFSMSSEKRKRPFRSALLISVGVLLAAAGGAAEKAAGLLPEHRLWLEDVEPIITRVERDVFLKLRTPQERETFIRFFWRARDPLPDTSENEFQKEYYERIRFADRYFGIGSHKRGSRTDRGFYYLLLGPPLERQHFTTQSEVFPLELWFYKGEEQYGLPSHFYLIFYQPRGTGDFRLYAPGVEGPEALVVPSMSGSTLNRTEAYKILKQIHPELAGASLSYLPGDTPYGSESFSSDLIVASIGRLPEKKYADGYARNYMAFKDHVETEYLDRFIESAHQAKIFKERGQPFLHWSLEPEKINFGTRGNTIYASYEFVLRLEDERGTPLFESTEEIPLRLTADQYKANERRRFAFQDILAVVPGNHKVLFLLKNKTARDFSSFEIRIAVPEEGRPGLSAPLFFHARSDVPEARRNAMKAFVFNGREYLVGARNEFYPSETLGVFLQAWDVERAGLPERPAFVVEILSFDTDESAGVFPLDSVEAPPAGGGTLLVSGKLPLEGVKPGYYRAEISALDPGGRKVLTQKENFIVLSRPYSVAPWVFAKLHGPFPGPEHYKILAGQYFLGGDTARARSALEAALREQDDPETRLLLAKTLFAQGLLREALAEALPLYERLPDRETAKVIALVYAGLKDWASALAYLEQPMAEATEVSVLNLAAECHLALGRPEKALGLIRKSLELLPDQPAIKELEEKTKKELEDR